MLCGGNWITRYAGSLGLSTTSLGLSGCDTLSLRFTASTRKARRSSGRRISKLNDIRSFPFDNSRHSRRDTFRLENLPTNLVLQPEVVYKPFKRSLLSILQKCPAQPDVAVIH